ncbi:hypothetical protein ELUMI_v1c02210 [Williamsoniiplasma luminosum]|uniref:Uncharacterized protein n=1 Tax=Williamsoniiplasma luminosum TaxID=214888 RepID=A0A2K8NTR1_9MOLU|nr:hypothetical protein [Williamsoniiplasma luminosum]ATZ16946.1 hypothetical protein ELUMI_v1c02210 [Williamsoniiplasma luminosum]AVP49614.1 MAG: hypothetical protein C5T88_03505 [Williamsoniiplasma luminosum]
MKTKFEGLYKSGLILTILGAALTIALIAIIASIFIATGASTNVDWYVDLAVMTYLWLITFVVILVPCLLIIVFSSISLKRQSPYQTIPIAVLSIIFGNIVGMIGAILMLCAPQDQANAPPAQPTIESNTN